MSGTRILLAAAVGMLLASSTAFAQSMGPMPPTGTSPGATGPTASHPHDGLDLPIGQPAFSPLQVDTPPPRNDDDDDGDDPRDTPPPTFYGEEIDSENDTIIYVIDRSGSMRRDPQPYTNGDGMVEEGSRLDRAKSELVKSISGLAQNFRFNIVGYNCSTIMWSEMLMPADEGNKASSMAWVMALEADGGTATGPGTALGLVDKNNMAVVLLTDGRPNCGASGHEGHRLLISGSNTQNATINVFGIAASGDYRSFCQAVASDSGGIFIDVP